MKKSEAHKYFITAPQCLRSLILTLCHWFLLSLILTLSNWCLILHILTLSHWCLISLIVKIEPLMSDINHLNDPLMSDITHFNTEPLMPDIIILTPRHWCLILYKWCILLRFTSEFVNPRIVMFTQGEAEVNVTFEGWLILMLTENEYTNWYVIWHCLSFLSFISSIFYIYEFTQVRYSECT